MHGKEPFELVFTTGVARFDADGNLFVNLRHSDDEPQDVRIGGGKSVIAPERRARVHGASSDGVAEGSFPATADLPRGLTIEVKGYRRARYEAGRLIVAVDAGAVIPDWFESGKEHLFAGKGPGLHLWAKSALPAGVTLQGVDALDLGPPTTPKPVARAQFQPVSVAAPAAAPPAPSSDKAGDAPSTPATGASKPEPYRPDRLAAGHYNPAGQAKKSALGCSTLLLLGALGVVAGLAAL